MANPNPKNKFQKGDKRAGRPAGVTNVMSKDIKILRREAAEEVGFIQRVREHTTQGAWLRRSRLARRADSTGNRGHRPTIRKDNEVAN